MNRGENLQPTSPSWLRSLARHSGAYLAMLALMLQLAASFAHVHARDFASGAGSDPAGGWHRLALTEATASAPGKLADDEDRCPICFSGFLLATSFVPQAAQPAPSVDFSEARHGVALALFGEIVSQTASFQSRAPPLG
jgi:hypothetical protein